MRVATQGFDAAPLARLIAAGAAADADVEGLAAQIFRSGFVLLRPEPATQTRRDACLRAIAEAIGGPWRSR